MAAYTPVFHDIPSGYSRKRILCPHVGSFNFAVRSSALTCWRSDFLESLDERSFFNAPQGAGSSQQTPLAGPSSSSSYPNLNRQLPNSSLPTMANPLAPKLPEGFSDPDVMLSSPSKTERFFLTAADQESGTRDERLARVIQSKYEAGLLKPHNYGRAYARLSRWMERKSGVPFYPDRL